MTPMPVDGDCGQRSNSRNPRFSYVLATALSTSSASFGRTKAKLKSLTVGKSVDFVLRTFALTFDKIQLWRCHAVRSHPITHGPAGDAASCQPAQFPVSP